MYTLIEKLENGKYGRFVSLEWDTVNAKYNIKYVKFPVIPSIQKSKLRFDLLNKIAFVKIEFKVIGE